MSPTTRHLEYASGYIELGMVNEASDELEAIGWNDRAGGLLNGYTPLVTNAVPSDLDKGASTGVCSPIIFGNFANFVMAEWWLFLRSSICAERYG